MKRAAQLCKEDLGRGQRAERRSRGLTLLIERLPTHTSRSKADLIDVLFALTRFEMWEFVTVRQRSKEAVEGSTPVTRAASKRFTIPPAKTIVGAAHGGNAGVVHRNQEAVRKFYETHPRGVGLRTMLANENYPVSPTDSKNMLHLHDAAGKVRARLGVGSDGNPLLEFLDSAGNVTHRYPPN